MNHVEITSRYAALAALVILASTGCGESNPRITTVPLVEASTYTRIDTVQGETLNLRFQAEAGRLVRFRAWSIGVLAGLDIQVLDPDGDVVYEGTSAGTEFRIDALEIAATGTHTVVARWLEGGGVSAYRYEVVGVASERLVVQTRPGIGDPRTGHASVRLPDGRLLITGGHSFASGLTAGAVAPLATTVIVDPASGQSTPGQQMLDARAYHAMAVFPGGPFEGQVFIAGGIGESGDALLTTELFDPATGEFSRGPDLPEPRAYLEALPIKVPETSDPLFLDNNIVLAFGERTRRGPQHSLVDGLYSEIDENRREIWRTEGDIVQRISNGDEAALLEVGRLRARMVFQPTSRSIMFIGGGVDTVPTAPGCAQSPDNVCHCTSQELPLCTEFRECEEGQCNVVRSYTRKDLATDIVEIHRDGQRITLPQSGRLNRARAAFGVAQLSGDRVIIAGGTTAVRRGFWDTELGLQEAPDTIDSVEMWTPTDPASGTEGSWRVLLPLSVPREHFTISALADGGLYAVGGVTPEPGGLRGVTVVERYDDDLLRFVPVGNLSVGRSDVVVGTANNETALWVVGGEIPGQPVPTVETVTLVSQ